MFDINRVSFVVGVAIATALALAGCGGGTEPNVAGPDRNGHYTGEMILIPAGSFLMGNNGSEPRSDPNELPQHSVSLSAYSIGKYEVTRGEYRAFITAGGYTIRSYWSSEGWSWKERYAMTQPPYWAVTQSAAHDILLSLETSAWDLQRWRKASGAQCTDAEDYHQAVPHP